MSVGRDISRPPSRRHQGKVVLFRYFPTNYVWNLSVDLSIEMGARIGEIEEMCAPLQEAAKATDAAGTQAFRETWVKMADKLAGLAAERGIPDPGLEALRIGMRASHESDVHHFHFAVGGDHHVARPQVRMYDTASMRMRKTCADAADDGERAVALHGFAMQPMQDVRKQLPLEELHDEEIRPAVAIEIEHIDDVWMRQRLSLVELALELEAKGYADLVGKAA